jgi:hypothetical protein
MLSSRDSLMDPTERTGTFAFGLLACVAVAAAAPRAEAWSSKKLPFFDPIHQQAIDAALEALGVPDDLRRVAVEQQAIVDDDQTTQDSFEHAMTGSEVGRLHPPDIQPWIAKADAYVRQHLTAAIQAGATTEGFQHLGVALHTLTDASSPVHQRFQPWAEDEGIIDKLIHVMQERAYPDEGSSERVELEGAVRWAYALFLRGEASLPPQFFTPDGLLALPDEYRSTPITTGAR